MCWQSSWDGRSSVRSSKPRHAARLGPSSPFTASLPCVAFRKPRSSQSSRSHQPHRGCFQIAPALPLQRVKLGRNEPCHCGSGKKYKRCHLAEDAQARSAANEPPSGATVARHMGRHMLASAGASDEAIDLAEQYFAAKDAGKGPAQQKMEYAQPLLGGPDREPEEVDRALQFAMLCWNVAIKPAEAREEALQSIAEHCGRAIRRPAGRSPRRIPSDGDHDDRAPRRDVP